VPFKRNDLNKIMEEFQLLLKVDLDIDAIKDSCLGKELTRFLTLI